MAVMVLGGRQNAVAAAFRATTSLPHKHTPGHARLDVIERVVSFLVVHPTGSEEPRRPATSQRRRPQRR